MLTIITGNNNILILLNIFIITQIHHCKLHFSIFGLLRLKRNVKGNQIINLIFKLFFNLFPSNIYKYKKYPLFIK